MGHICDKEDRIRRLEQSEVVQKTELQHLIGRLDNLTVWIRALVITLLTSALGAFGFLLWQVISNKGR